MVKQVCFVRFVLIEDISPIWESDSKIDRTELGSESLRTEQLHAKYWKMFAQARRDARQLESQLKRLRLDKWEWYTHGPSKETKNRNWRLPPAGRVLKNDAEKYVEGDPDFLALQEKYESHQDGVKMIEGILKAIAFRQKSIRDFMDWEFFQNGIARGKIG